MIYVDCKYLMIFSDRYETNSILVVMVFIIQNQHVVQDCKIFLFSLDLPKSSEHSSVGGADL